MALATKFAEPINNAVALEPGQPRDAYDKERALVREQVKKIALHAARTYDEFLAEAGGEKKAQPGAFYSVNVLVDNSKTQGAPVVFSNASNFASLLGSLKKNMRIIMTPTGGAIPLESEAGPTVKAGDYLKANGGFLVLPLTMDLLRQPGAWYALMRAAATGVLELGDGENQPVQIPAKVKVVLIGSPMLRNLLAENDESFSRNFRVVANFTSKLKIDAETIDGYLQFFAKSVMESQGDILPLTQSAMAALMEHSARLISSNEDLSSQFGALYGLMREATYFAKAGSKAEVSEDSVQRALEMRGGSVDIAKKWYQDHIQSGKTVFDLEGERLNQINGLVVLGSEFGLPKRITAAVSRSAGTEGLSVILNDKEAGWTGASADKSMANIRGYLETLYGKQTPLALRLSFEQLYGGMDGDSATTAMDVLARLSVAGIPIRQDGAVTGSADQLATAHSQIIGGVNQKIEGVFDALENKKGGLTGSEFVVIPKTNAGDLMLAPKIVKAVEEGKFHVYAIETVDQAVEIFSGMPIEEVRLLETLHLKEIAASNFVSRMFWRALYRSTRSVLIAMPMQVPIRSISTAQFRTNGMGPGPVRSAKPMPAGYRGPGA